MSIISNLNSSLLNSYLLNTQQSSSDQSATEQKANITETDSQTQTSGSGTVDVVTLSKEIIQQSSEALLEAQNNWFTETDESDNSDALIGGLSTSSDSMYDILLTQENARLMEAGPDLVKNIVSEEQDQSSGDSAGTLAQVLKNLDLLGMNPDTLLAIQQKYGVSSASEQTSSGAQVDKKA